MRLGVLGTYTPGVSCDTCIDALAILIREEALQLFRQSPFFAAWDPEALNVYVECATYPTQDPSSKGAVVALKMPGIQEAVVFADGHTRCEVYHRLPELNERIELRWIMPGNPEAGEYVSDIAQYFLMHHLMS